MLWGIIVAMDQPSSPEAAVRVDVTELEVVCTRPSGLVERVRWDALRAVLIETTDQGPWATDVFWILIGSTGGCVVPQGATGEAELLRRLQALSGFDNEAVIAAMASTENARFLCWQHPES